MGGYTKFLCQLALVVCMLIGGYCLLTSMFTFLSYHTLPDDVRYMILLGDKERPLSSVMALVNSNLGLAKILYAYIGIYVGYGIGFIGIGLIFYAFLADVDQNVPAELRIRMTTSRLIPASIIILCSAILVAVSTQGSGFIGSDLSGGAPASGNTMLPIKPSGQEPPPK